MKVYWVLGYERYYPGSDNFQASFETYEEAQAYIENEKAKEHTHDEDDEDDVWVYQHYEIIDITDRI